MSGTRPGLSFFLNSTSAAAPPPMSTVSNSIAIIAGTLSFFSGSGAAVGWGVGVGVGSSVDAAMKKRDQMGWVQAMNSLKAQAEEQVIREMILA